VHKTALTTFPSCTMMLYDSITPRILYPCFTATHITSLLIPYHLHCLAYRACAFTMLRLYNDTTFS